MMTVVNYSVQETFGNNLFFWEGLGWFEKLLNSDRFHAALGRQFMFTRADDAAAGHLGAVLSGHYGAADAGPLECGWCDVEYLYSARHRLAWVFYEQYVGHLL